MLLLYELLIPHRYPVAVLPEGDAEGVQLGEGTGVAGGAGGVDVSYIPNWVENIERMHRALPEEVKRDFQEEYLKVMRNIRDYCRKLLGPQDPTVKRVEGMI